MQAYTYIEKVPRCPCHLRKSRPNDDKQWVKYTDVAGVASAAEKQRETNIELRLEIDRLKGIIAEHDRAVFNVEKIDEPDTRTNQVLNELYHDRARLERQLKHAAELAADAATAFQELLNLDYGDQDEPMTEELVAAITAGSKLGEFAEANSDD